MAHKFDIVSRERRGYLLKGDGTRMESSVFHSQVCLAVKNRTDDTFQKTESSVTIVCKALTLFLTEKNSTEAEKKEAKEAKEAEEAKKKAEKGKKGLKEVKEVKDVKEVKEVKDVKEALMALVAHMDKETLRAEKVEAMVLKLNNELKEMKCEKEEGGARTGGWFWQS
tara:strand:+ start:1490 stop:1993 length:504 start_codon:yes stop_codon:yes gene_type:complete